MKCLSVKQPWASLIASGRKTIELRTWRTNYRGPLIICASSKAQSGTRYEIGPLGVTTALVNLVDVTETVDTDERRACHPVEGYLAWHLRLVKPLPPVSAKGQLSLFAPSRDLLSALGIEQP